MQTNLIVGNIFSFCAVVCIAISVVKKTKAQLIWWQTLDVVFYIFASIVLGSYAGISTNLVCLLRNVIAYKDKLTRPLMWLLVVLCVVSGLYVNNLGVIGYFPILASGSYTVFLYVAKDKQMMLYALIVNLSLWFVHDLYIQAYPSAATDLLLSLWAAYRAVKEMKGVPELVNKK